MTAVVNGFFVALGAAVRHYTLTSSPGVVEKPPVDVYGLLPGIREEE